MASETDWKKVELDYRAGVKSLEQIGNENGITKGRISQVAKRDGWTRDLKVRIKAKADAKVAEAALNDRLNAGVNRLAEKSVVEANAELQYQVRMNHRSGLKRLSGIKDKLLGHIESVVDNFGDIGAALDDLQEEEGDKSGRLIERMRAVMGRSAVIDDLKKLSEIDEKVRKGEREAFGIDNEERSANSVDDLLAKINAAN